MEDVLDVYHRSPDPRRPVVCMDETSKQLVGEVTAPRPPRPGQPARVEHEYVRNGTAAVFLEVEPLTGRVHVAARAQRTRQDWAHWIRDMLEQRYPDAERVTRVMDNLNTHDPASLYATFPPAEAQALARRLEIHYTPKRGSWLNIAEIELSVLARQCLARRIPAPELLDTELAAWGTARNARRTPVRWQFMPADARTRLRHLYPTV